MHNKSVLQIRMYSVTQIQIVLDESQNLSLWVFAEVKVADHVVEADEVTKSVIREVKSEVWEVRWY